MRFTAPLVAAASLFSLAAAQVTISNPSSANWWVAKSANVLTWDCTKASFQQFTLLIANTNPAILVAPMPIIAIVQNSDCSHTITQDQANQAPATGYTLLFANILNSTDILATSEPFEIKALGSLYPSQAASLSSSTASSTSAASSSSSSSTAKSGAVSLSASAGSIAALALMGLGLVLSGVVVA